ncbi:MAG TPA: phosphatidylglycerophosphatase A [Lacipirellulaceae bacterium]|nr:phosphatidylglycerophosphatase A [Lacipirellulaceae bacterium]
MPPKTLTAWSNSATGRAAVWLATGLGVGFVTPAPGTVAGLWGIGLAYLVDKAPNLEVQAALIAALLLATVGICGIAARAMGDAEDPQPITLDEITVLPIVFLGVGTLSWQVVLAGFLLFRLFDVMKPGLVRHAEKLPGGWGIVADDVVAAGLAWAVLRGVLWIDRAAAWHWLAPSG